MWRSIPDHADAARCTKNWTPSRFPVLKNTPWTGFAVERANQPGLPVPRHKTGSLATQQGWDGLVFQLAKAVWNPPRPSYFADDLVDTQRLGVAAAERCQHVLEAVFLARLGFGESNRADHEAAITACTRAVERASARRCLGAVGGPVHPCPCVHHLSGNPGSACGERPRGNFAAAQMQDRNQAVIDELLLRAPRRTPAAVDPPKRTGMVRAG